MILFFSRIAPGTREEDIYAYVAPIVKGNVLQKTGVVKDIQILILKDILLDKLEYHAMVTIEPDEVAHRVHKKLNRKPINGKHVAVRNFVSRSWHADLRVNTQGTSEILIDRRIGDRRRGFRMKRVDNTITSFKGRKVYI